MTNEMNCLTNEEKDELVHETFAVLIKKGSNSSTKKNKMIYHCVFVDINQAKGLIDIDDYRQAKLRSIKDEADKEIA